MVMPMDLIEILSDNSPRNGLLVQQTNNGLLVQKLVMHHLPVFSSLMLMLQHHLVKHPFLLGCFMVRSFVTTVVLRLHSMSTFAP
jgi:hypothetical protein